MSGDALTLLTLLQETLHLFCDSLWTNDRAHRPGTNLKHDLEDRHPRIEGSLASQWPWPDVMAEPCVQEGA